MTEKVTRFPNRAGDHPDTDDILRAELKAAGILTLQEHEGKPPEYLADLLRQQSGEVKTSVIGILAGWKFIRAWYYWVATGPGIPAEKADELYRDLSLRPYLRVAGHAGSPCPREWFKGLGVGTYHVDTAEALFALAATLKEITAENDLILDARVAKQKQLGSQLSSGLSL